MIITQKQGSVQPLEERNRELEEQLSISKGENASLKEQLNISHVVRRQMEIDDAYEDDLFANGYLSPAHKVLLRTIRRIIHSLRIDDSTPTVIHLSELVNKTAISVAQIKRLIDELDSWGLITKETIKWREGSKWKSEMRISMGGEIKHPKEIVTPHKRPGGDQRCHKCGSKNIEPSVYYCKDCGHYGQYD